MITSKKMLREYLAADAAANKKPPIARYPLVCRLAGWYNMLYINYMRRCEYIDGSKGSGFFSSLVERYYWRKMKKVGVLTGFQISPNTCGKGLYLPHWGSILVNGNARLGERCVIQSGVLVAEGVRGGDHIYFSVGSKVLRDVTLADDIIVAANAVVNKSFTEPDIVVGGIPAKKISDKGFRSRTVV